MRPEARPWTISVMATGSTRTAWAHARRVYAAALPACSDPQVAEAITERVLTSAVRQGGGDVRLDCQRLIEEAIVLAMRVDPAPAFAEMPLDEREAVALARLGGCSALEIALVLETSVAGVKAAMLRGLGRLSRAAEPAAA